MGAAFGVCFKVTATKVLPCCTKRCCPKKAAPIKIHELAFMTVVSEGFAYNKPEIIDAVFDLASAEGK